MRKAGAAGNDRVEIDVTELENEGVASSLMEALREMNLRVTTRSVHSYEYKYYLEVSGILAWYQMQ